MRGRRLITFGVAAAACASRPEPRDTSEVAKLVEAIEGGTPAEREEALDRLVDLREEGAPALPALARAWRAKEDVLFTMAAVAPRAPETRAAVLHEVKVATKDDAGVFLVLAMFPAAARAAAPEIAGLLESDDEGLRGRAASALTIADEAGVAALPVYERWLAGGETERGRALRGLAALGESAAPAAPLVIRLLEGEDPKTIAGACLVLWAIGPGGSAAAPRLARLHSEGPEEIRIAAAAALGRVDPSRRAECVATLREALSSEDRAFVARVCLARLGKEGVLALVEHGTKRNELAADEIPPTQRMDACEIPLALMEEIRFTAAPLDALLRDPATRAEIGSLFDRAGASVGQLAWVAETRGLGGWVRLSIWAQTVGSNMARATPLQGHEGPFASFLTLDGEHLVTAGSDVRFELFRTPGDPAAAARVLRTGNPVLRWLAVRELGRTKDALAAEPLRAALRDPVPYVRDEAAAALAAAGRSRR